MILYRAEVWNDSEIFYSEHKVIKETGKSWIIPDYRKQRVISKTSIKKYAYPTKKEAFESLLARRVKYRQHLVRNLRWCLADLRYLFHIKDKEIKLLEENNGTERVCLD